MIMHPSSRRAFMQLSGLAISGTMLGSRLPASQADVPKSLFTAMGIAGSLNRAAVLKSHGADFLTVGTIDLLVPDQPDEMFEKKLAMLKASPLPVLACNGFIRPAHLRCVGAEANHDQVLEWSDIAFRRMKQAGVKFMVFGSSKSRELRDGWTKEKADAQFISLLKRMGPLAQNHGAIVVVEQLREQECNFINHISEAAALIRAADHPNIRVLADLFHMASVGDTPEDLKAAMDVVVHIEIAEKAGRTYPGVAGDDFRPYFRILREAAYHGAISIEGEGTEDTLAAAFREIAKQAAEV